MATAAQRKRTINSRAGAKSAGKVVRMKPKKAVKQTGKTTIARDKKIQAKKPGTRVTSRGTTYTETRANRSDKGVMLGTMGQVMQAGKIILLKKLGDLTGKKFMAKKKSDKNRIQKEITQVQKDLKKFIN